MLLFEYVSPGDSSKFLLSTVDLEHAASGKLELGKLSIIVENRGQVGHTLSVALCRRSFEIFDCASNPILVETRK